MINIRVDYDDLHDSARELLMLADDIDCAMGLMRDARNELEGGEWQGQGASVFFDELDEVALPALNRLIIALVHASDDVMKPTMVKFDDAEAEALRYLWSLLDATGIDQKNRSVDSGGTGVTADGGKTGDPTRTPIDVKPDKPFDAITDWILENKRGFKFGGDLLGLVPAEALMVGLGIMPEPVVSKVLAVAAGIASVGSPILKYLEKFDEEPEIFRGGSIALVDAGINTLIDMTGVGAGINMVNSANQVFGAIDVAAGHWMANNLNLSGEMADRLRMSAERMYTTNDGTDLGNITYEASRALVSMSNNVNPVALSLNGLDALGFETAGDISSMLGLSPERNDIGRDFNRFTDSFGQVWNSAQEYPDVMFDYTMTQGASAVEHVVNQSGLSDSFKGAFSNAANTWTEQIHREPLLDSVKKILLP